MRIRDKVFVVTGASSGLGAATARRLVGAGASVVMCDLDAARGEPLAAELGPRAAFCRVDVANESDASTAIAITRDHFLAIHGLVNCAGVGPAERIVGKTGPHSLDRFVRCLHVNLVGTFNMIRLVASAMSQQEPDPEGQRGVIINTASITAFEGQIGQAAYAASKAGGRRDDTTNCA